MTGHAGVCVWFTGLSGSGKSTTADALVELIIARGREVTVLDGDVVRTHLSKGLGFSREDRDTNVRRIGYVAAEVVRHGGIAVAAVVSPYRATRDEVRAMMPAGGYLEVFVDTPIEVCEQRDVKGWYARARTGEVSAFTGVDDSYEPPLHPELTLHTVDTAVEANAQLVLRVLEDRGHLGAGLTMSFDDILTQLRAHGLNPADGLQVVTLRALLRRPVDPTMALVILPDAADVAIPAAATSPAGAVPPAVADGQAAYLPVLLPGRGGHGGDAADLLRRLYPADHPVEGLDGATDTTVGTISAAALAGGTHLVAPLPDLANAASPWGLPWLVARLRAPGGCPWDREQDHRSLRPFLLEEAYEVYDALEEAPGPRLAEELGDLLLQIVLHAEYAAEAGIFDLSDVQRSIMTKIVRRHPHVFGDGAARTTDEVIRTWEVIKADERLAADAGSPSVPTDRDMPAAFAGLSRSLPALAYADEMQERAASLGYDWPDLEGVIDKVAEEATELLRANDQAERVEEYGDLMFVLVNLARKLDIDPEASLRGASRKFARRFAGVERLAAERRLELKALGLDALDELWQDVKREEAVARDELTAEGEGQA